MRKIFALLLFFFAIGNAQAVLRAVAGTTGSVINASGGVTAGAAVSYTDTGFLVQGAASSAPYVQFAVQNTSTSSNASADYIAANNVTTSSTNYTDMGINSSTYSEGGGALQGAGNGYFFCQSVDCFFGTGSQNIVHIGTNALPGGLTTDAAQVINNQFYYLNGIQVVSGGAPTYNATGDGNVFNVTASSAGAPVTGAPYMQVGYGAGNSAGIILGTLSNGVGGIWSTGIAPSASNYAMSIQNGSNYINAPSGGIVTIRSNGNAAGFALSGGGLIPEVTGGLTLGSASNAWGSFFQNGGVTSAGSAVSGGSNVWSYGTGFAGMPAGAPYAMVGNVTTGASGSGNAGWLLGTVSTGASTIWSGAQLSGQQPSSTNYTFNEGASNLFINTPSTGHLQTGAAVDTATWNATSFNVGTQINLINSTGAISAGSYTANSNGIENSAGQIGHLISNSVASAGSAVSTGSPANIGSLASLAPGVYDVWAQCDWNIFAATVTQQQCGISYTSATLLTQAGGTSGGATISNDPYAHSWQATTTTLGDMSLSVGPVRVKITATSTIYQVGSLTFSAGTAKAFGSIRSIQVEHDMFKRLQEQWMDSQLVDAPMVPDKLLFNTDRLHPRPDLM